MLQLTVYLNIAVFICLYESVTPQPIIPKRPLGYVYKCGSNDAPIHLDVHMEPLCSDSRDALPVVKMVARYYGTSTLKLTVHMFPLPYHRQSYLTAIGVQAVRKLQGLEAAFRWFDTIYSNLDTMSNEATANLTTNGVVSRLSKFASIINIPVDQFLHEMSSKDLETDTRAAWKYSCSRGFSSTPTFLLNDVLVISASPSWTLSDWQNIIDPLLKGMGITQGLNITSGECKPAS